MTDLHRKFAKVKQNEAGVLRFAGKYGLLEAWSERPNWGKNIVGHGAFLATPDSRKGGYAYIHAIESLSFWLREIRDMKHLMHVWDLIKVKNAGALSKWVKWTTLSSHPDEPGPHWTKNRVLWKEMEAEFDAQGRLILESGRHSMELGREDSQNNPIPDSWRVGDILAPAYYYLCRKINDRLEKHVDPVVMPFMRGDIYLWPDCLLSAMYVLFALEASGKTRPPIICTGCGTYFTPVHGRQSYCATACRKREHWRKHHGKSEIKAKAHESEKGDSDE